MQTVERTFPLAAVQGHDLRGKALTHKELARLLAKEVVVMVSADANPVDVLHLRLLRAGTPVLVLPVLAPVIERRRGPGPP
jgi:hypothetical protein